MHTILDDAIHTRHLLFHEYCSQVLHFSPLHDIGCVLSLLPKYNIGCVLSLLPKYNITSNQLPLADMSSQETNVNANSETAFASLFKQMIDLSNKNTKESAAQADQIAHHLLSYAECPLLFRVHAHLTLSCGNDNYVWHAQQALEMVELGGRLHGASETYNGLKATALEQLRRARRDRKQLDDMEAQWKAEGKQVLQPGEDASDFVVTKHRYGIPGPDDEEVAKPWKDSMEQAAKDEAEAEVEDVATATTQQPNEGDAANTTEQKPSAAVE